VKRYTKERFDKQQRIIQLYDRMCIQPTLTCTPYYLRKPAAGQHLAWAESSAVVYANSVLKAWTNREGSPSALAAALIGKTPNYGVHRPENRKPNVLVEVEAPLETEVHYGALGIHLGKLLKEKVPALDGLRGSDDDLKQLGAAMASSGMTTLFDTVAVAGKERLETISVEAKDIEQTVASLCTTDRAPDLVFVGCPHCSARELRTLATLLQGKKVRREVEFWACTSRHVRDKAKNYVEVVEQAGGHVLCDTCVLVSWIKDLRFKSLLTNSAKTAFYAPTLNEVDVALKPLYECIEAACYS